VGRRWSCPSASGIVGLQATSPEGFQPARLASGDGGRAGWFGEHGRGQGKRGGLVSVFKTYRWCVRGLSIEKLPKVRRK
jgi:hypothetical protein